MAHGKLRVDKNCLNCGATVEQRYCPSCGQENVEVKQGFTGYATHFIYDILHFDGQFFKTLTALIKAPGRVAREYVAGKRKQYLDPVRMYLFLSAITFFLFPLIINVQSSIKDVRLVATPLERLKQTAHAIQRQKEAPGDLENQRKLQVLLDTSSVLLLKSSDDSTLGAIDFLWDDKLYKAIPVPVDVLFPERNWFERRISRNMKTAFQKEGEDINRLVALQNMAQFKMLPYVFFLSLPLFTLILTLFYNRPKRPFSDHAIFTLYHYISGFVLLLLFLLFYLFTKAVKVSAPILFYLPLTMAWLVYLLLELKNFYREKWLLTIFKFLIIVISSVLIMAGLFIVFLVLNILY